MDCEIVKLIYSSRDVFGGGSSGNNRARRSRGSLQRDSIKEDVVEVIGSLQDTTSALSRNGQLKMK